jgi:hypothetical protein
MEETAKLLIRRIEKTGQTWPLLDERKNVKQVLKWAAFREADKEHLKNVADWEMDRGYLVDPLPEKISEAYASLLFGESPHIEPADEADTDALETLLEDSDMAAELRWGETLCSSEGEVWWRIYANRSVSDHPLIEFHSRELVVPHWIGNRLVAAAFVSEFLGPDTAEGEERTVWRHFEVHSEGLVQNLLYRGTSERVGNRVDLGSHPETEDLGEVWEHGLPGMLCGRIANKLGRNRRLGISDYRAIEDYLLALNEAVTIGHENARLTLKKRVVVPRNLLKPRVETVDNGDGSRSVVHRPTFDASEDVFAADDMDTSLDGKDSGPYKVLEYSFDAQALVEYKRDLVTSALTRAGITPQFVGSYTGQEGAAETGTALRVRLIPTTSAAHGKGQYWDGAIPRMLLMAQLLDALPTTMGGFGVSWTAAGEPPSFERTDPLPQDPMESAQRHSVLVAAEIESTETAVRELHPSWSDDQVQEELDRIAANRPDPMPAIDLSVPELNLPGSGSGDEPPAL